MLKSLGASREVTTMNLVSTVNTLSIPGSPAHGGGHTLSLSLSNLEDWDFDVEARSAGGGGPLGIRPPCASTPISESHRGAPFDPVAVSPVRDDDITCRRGSFACLGIYPAQKPLRGRHAGSTLGPHRATPVTLGPKWRLFKRKTCPDLFKTKSTDNLFRNKHGDGTPLGISEKEDKLEIQVEYNKSPEPEEEPSSKKSSRTRLERALKQEKPYAQVVLPETGYWYENSEANHQADNYNNNNSRFESDEVAPLYRRYFMEKEHFSFFGEDETLGPLVLSYKPEMVGTQDSFRVLLRLQSGTYHTVIIRQNNITPADMAKHLREELVLSSLQPALTPHTSELIAAYDEHVLVNTFKFGLLYQRIGQTTEEQMFSNTTHSREFDEFLDLIGRRVKLKDHQGFRGGLDIQYGQTGDETVYEVFREKQIMFHVSTFLPYKENDVQQLQRKRHIGNDIVAIVFQEGNTPFAPDMIASHFLHSYVVIQPFVCPAGGTRYRVSVTAQSDVPYFGPSLPCGAVFKHGQHFKDFLLTKLINAEIACLKAGRFANLEQRTRSSLLSALVEELRIKTNTFMGIPEIQREAPKTEKQPKRFSKIVRKIIESRKEAQAQHRSNKSSSGHNASCLSEGTPVSMRSKCSRSSGGSSGVPTPASSPETPHLRITAAAASESDDSSLNSVDLDIHPGGHMINDDSDTGLESMSSAEHHQNHRSSGPSGQACIDEDDEKSKKSVDHNKLHRQVDGFKREMSKLKYEKLDLLRQNVTSQKEIKKLKEKELKLTVTLNESNAEVTRLKTLIKDLRSGTESAV